MTKAILLLLMIQNNVFALKCTFGVVFGDPYNQEGTKRGNLIPSSWECQNPEDKCLRIEVDEITDPDSQLVKDVIAMKCATDCEDNFENKDEEFLNEHVKTFISGTEGKFFTKGDKGARAKCCSEPDCNKQSISQQEENNAGSKQKLTHMNLLAVVLFVGAFIN